MSGFLTQVKHSATNLDLRHGRGLVSHGVQVLEYGGASWLSARLNTQYGDKVKVRGVEATYVVGVLAQIGLVLADVFGVGIPGAEHVNTVSLAAIGTHWAAKGAASGAEAAARSRASSTALPAARTTAVGAIPPAPSPARWLDQSQINRIAAMHGA